MSVSTRSSEPSMLEIAEQTLAEIHAMRALSQCEDALLTLIDGAATGEILQHEAESALEAHLAAREARVRALQELNGAWSCAVARSGGTLDPELARVASVISQSLLELESADARFAAELTERRRAAHQEIGRADVGRAAQRAYGPTNGAVQPRFTDRRG